MIRAHSLLLLLAAGASAGIIQKPEPAVSVLIHGRPLFTGILADAAVLVRFEDFSRQVEGPAGQSRNLIAVRRDAVHVTDSGGCARCPLTAKRPGRIGPLRYFQRQRYVALDDIARALGATVQRIDRSVYSMTCEAGECLGGILGSVQ